MFGARKLGTHHPSPYATMADFCRIFAEDMNQLYRLSFLLTGDEAVAEQCFVGSLHIAQKGNPVFKEWTEAWARRTIILTAIRMIRPRLIADSSDLFGRVAGDAPERTEIAEIVRLPVFERFAFVMSVLEGYSDHECSFHLRCSRGEVAAARARALERIGRAAELRGNLVSVASAHKQQKTDSGPESEAELRPLSIGGASGYTNINHLVPDRPVLEVDVLLADWSDKQMCIEPASFSSIDFRFDSKGFGANRQQLDIREKGGHCAAIRACAARQLGDSGTD